MITLPFVSNDIPLYRQIYEVIKNEIQTGNMKAAEKIPSKRKLSAHLSVSVNTIDTAYSQLAAEGYIEAIPKKGYFVCEVDEYHSMHIELSKNSAPASTKKEIKIDFSPGDIDHDSFPFNTWRTLTRNCFNEFDNTLFKRTQPQGDIYLRKALVKFLHSSRGVNCSEEQIVIGAGTDNLLQAISLTLGNDKLIALENPVYRKAYKIFEQMGHHVQPILIDDKGIEIEQLQNLTNAVVYVTPSHQFPLGISMPIGRRIKLLNFANETKNRYIIEDDYDSEFRYSGKPLPSLQSIDKNGKVIYIGTFSKSIAPTLRISYMVLPQPLLSAYYEKFGEFSSVVSTFEQRILADFINDGHFEKHLNKMRKIYKEKRQHLMNELSMFEDRIKVVGDNAGHHLLVKLQNGMSEAEMCKSAALIGIKVYPFSDYFIGELPRKYYNKVLLGYGALSKQEISDGVKKLFGVWKSSV